MKHADDFRQDDVLLQTLTQTVLKNLENEQFSVEELSEQIGISRSHLHRKLKLLKGKSVSQFIREVRLEEAMKLLQNDVATAAEIAYRVGFGSTSYFNTCFHAHYGYPPGEVKKRALKNNLDTAIQSTITEEKLSEQESLSANHEKEVIPPKTSYPQNKQRWKMFVSAALGLLGIFLAVFYYYTTSSEIDISHPKAIAVLPLDNLSGDDEQEYLAAGMHDALIGELGKISGLRVISKTSTLRYPESNMLVQEIATELGVDMIVEGSVFVAGDSLRIQVQLIEAFPEERHLWAQEYYQDIRHVLSMQNNVIHDIARKIQVNLTPEEERRLTHARTVDPETYKTYLRGMYYLNKSTPEEFQKGLVYLNQAIENDPADPLAYAQLAIGYAIIGHGPDPSYPIWQRGKAAALRAIRLDSTLAEAHAALAFIKAYYEWDWEGAERAFIRANAINPNLAISHFHYAWYLVILGRMDEAIVEHKLAKELDPLTPIYTADMGSLYNWVGRHDEAIVEIKQALELDKSFGHAWWALGNAYALKGEYDQAIEAHMKAMEVNPVWQWALGNTYAMAGQWDKALTIVSALKTGNITPKTAFGLALIYTSLGDMDEAFHWLEFQPPDTWIPWVRTWPEFEPLRKDPRFIDFLKEKNLPPV